MKIEPNRRIRLRYREILSWFGTRAHQLDELNFSPPGSSDGSSRSTVFRG